MYRRTGIVLFLIFSALAGWMFLKDVTYERSKSIDFDEGSVTSVYTICGDVLPILFEQEFGEDVPPFGFYMQEQCTKAARSHFAWIALFGATGLTFLIVGLIRGPAPKVWEIDAMLERLPSAASVSEDGDEDPA
jgi:hypothetical protein